MVVEEFELGGKEGGEGGAWARGSQRRSIGCPEGKAWLERLESNNNNIITVVAGITLPIATLLHSNFQHWTHKKKL
jgi:hypothetical protein